MRTEWEVRLGNILQDVGFRNWQLGYRKLPLTGTPYTTPYRDLPEFTDTKEAAYALHSRMSADFQSAEWRLVEVITK